MVKRIFGLLILLAGVLLLLDNLDIYAVENWGGLLWPTALILIGFFSMIESKRISSFNCVLMAIGTLFLLINLNILQRSMITPYIAPGIIIYIGLTFLLSRRSKAIIVSNRTHYTAIFGGVEEKSNKKDFVSCEITAVFGAAEIDLSEIELKSDKAVINLTAIFGGVNVRLPRKYRVIATGTPILGGFENRLNSREVTDDNSLIVINYQAVFGGIEIKD